MATETQSVPQQPGSLLRSLGLAVGIALVSILLLDYALPALLQRHSLILPAWYSMKVHFVCSNLAPILVVLPVLYPSSFLRGIRRELRTALLVIICFALLYVLRLGLAILYFSLTIRSDGK